MMTVEPLTLTTRELRKPVLDRVDRVTEMLFGLFMALSFVGAISVASSGQEEIRLLLVAALGCNLAWGITDAFMYLVGTLSHRGNLRRLVAAVRAAPDAAAGGQLIRHYLDPGLAAIITLPEVEAIRARIVTLPDVPDQPALQRDDLLAALGVFLIVVASTLPVALPFVLLSDVGTAMLLSRLIALVMLFGGGVSLGRHAGYNLWLSGFGMMGLGVLLVAVIMALGG